MVKVVEPEPVGVLVGVAVGVLVAVAVGVGVLVLGTIGVPSAVDAVLQRVQRAVVDAAIGEVVQVGGVMAIRVIRGQVGRVGGDGDRRGEAHLLPAAGRLADKVGTG